MPRPEIEPGALAADHHPHGGWTRRLPLALAALGLPALCYGLATAYLILEPIAQDHAHRIAFDAAAWRDQSRDASPWWPTRLRMIDDLIGDKRLDGLTRAEVESLLGPGDRGDKWAEWHLAYYLGPERGLIRIDSEWLVIRFAASGGLAEYRLVRD